MGWMNDDGLYVRFGTEQAADAAGGEVNTWDEHTVEFDITSDDAQSATASILGETGAFGVVVPDGARVKAVVVDVLTAFTSSGTIGSATLVLGLKKASDRSTELDHDGLLTSAFTGTNLDAVGEHSEVFAGDTGAGALLGTTLTENGVIVVANSTHGTNPFTAGRARVKVIYDRV